MKTDCLELGSYISASLQGLFPNDHCTITVLSDPWLKADHSHRSKWRDICLISNGLWSLHLLSAHCVAIDLICFTLITSATDMLTCSNLVLLWERKLNIIQVNVGSWDDRAVQCLFHWKPTATYSAKKMSCIKFPAILTNKYIVYSRYVRWLQWPYMAPHTL